MFPTFELGWVSYTYSALNIMQGIQLLLLFLTLFTSKHLSQQKPYKLKCRGRHTTCERCLKLYTQIKQLTDVNRLQAPTWL